MTSNLMELTDAVGDVELGQTVGNVGLAEKERITSVIVAIFFSKLSDMLLLWVVAIASLMETLSRVWSDNYFPLVFEKEDETQSTLGFIIKALLAFAAIKSQEQIGFPFKTHPQAIMVSITSLLIYGFASAAQHVFSAQGADPLSVYAITARLGRIASLCILVGSLAFLFYFGYKISILVGSLLLDFFIVV